MRKIVLICFALVSVFAQGQWTQQSSPTSNNLNSAFFPNANTGYAVGDSGTIIKTINAGATWVTLSSGTATWLSSVFFTDANTGYAVGGDYNGGVIIKTIDGGATWDTLSSGTIAWLHSIFFTNANAGYAVGTSGTIIKTSNGGATWDILDNVDYAGNLNSVYFTDANTGYALGGDYSGGFMDGIIIKTTDGGSTWTVLFSTPAATLNSIYFTDASKGYAVGYVFGECRGIIVKIVDGSVNSTESWTIPITREFPLKSVYFTDTNTGYIVSEAWSSCHGESLLKNPTTSIIIKTTDGGTTWDSLLYVKNCQLHSVFFTDSNSGFIVGDSGTILKTTNGGGLVSTEETPPPQSTFTIYPNPATNKIAITTTINKSNEQVQISIFSINGQLIRSDKFQKPERFEMDVSTMQKGIYLLRIQRNVGVETQKLVLQ